MLPGDLLRKLREERGGAGGDDDDEESAHVKQQKRARREEKEPQPPRQPQPPHNANVRNEYGGWRPRSTTTTKNEKNKKGASPPHVLDRVPMADVTPRTFFQKYVAARKPVVLTGGLQGTQWERAYERWTDAFLSSAAGDAEVRVEIRGRTDEPYGVGRYEMMRFAAFMKRFSAGDERCYLTASPAARDAHGRSQVAAAPASRLLNTTTTTTTTTATATTAAAASNSKSRISRNDGVDEVHVPFRPALAGNLVPANVNVWMGNSGGEAGSTSVRTRKSVPSLTHSFRSPLSTYKGAFHRGSTVRYKTWWLLLQWSGVVRDAV